MDDFIIFSLVEGVITLILIYREYSRRGEIIALCPWLHSTEMCEHTFGECRKLIKDFIFLDFIFMVPRLQILLRSITKYSNVSDPKARASGYSHTYFDDSSVRLDILSQYPSDDDIQEAAKLAWTETENLMIFLGIRAEDAIGTRATAPYIVLLSIDSWYSSPSPNSHSSTSYSLSVEEYYSDDEDDSSSDGSIDEMAELQSLIDWGEKSGFIESNERAMELVCAAVALSMDGSVQA